MWAFSINLMIKITDKIKIEEWEITESFMRSSGPGGQHVNKVSSAVELRFEAERSPNLPSFVKVSFIFFIPYPYCTAAFGFGNNKYEQKF